MLQIQNNQSNNSNHFRWSSEQPNLTGTYQEREGGREEKKREEKRRKEKKREEKKRKERKEKKKRKKKGKIGKEKKKDQTNLENIY